MEPNNPGRELEIVEVFNNGFEKIKPELEACEIYGAEIDHFIDCITSGIECIAKPEEALALVEILNAIYESAETGKAIYF